MVRARVTLARKTRGEKATQCSPVGTTKTKGLFSHLGPMLIEAQTQKEVGMGGGAFKSHKDLFKLQENLYAGIKVRIRADAREVAEGTPEETSITLTLGQAERFAESLQQMVKELRQSPET